MEETRQQLVAAGVIGGVVDDFLPRKEFYVMYGEKEIRMGDQVSAADVEGEPDFIDYDYDGNDEDNLEVKEIFENSTYVFVMTDLDANGHEYLHWILANFTAAGRDDDKDFIGECLVAYEPPKREGTRRMVFTFFKKNASEPIAQAYNPIAREIFSTRDFARDNGLGPPLAAGFFYIKNENDGQ